MTARRRESGFTLIELMITVAIVAILAAIAIPSYQSYIRKSRRTDAQALLQAAQLAEEKYRLNNTIYAATANFTDTAFAGVCPTSGSCLSQGGYYTLTATAGTAGVSYTLTATPVSGTSQAADTACSPMTIAQTSAGVTNSPADCWSK
jgi:type IV pilus assembly protein PilE